MADDTVNPSVFYVYILYRDAEKTMPFYVGMARRRRRILDHTKPEYLSGPSFKAAVLRSVVRRLGFVPHVIFASDLTEATALALEAELIHFIGRIPTGPLTNQTAGGAGAANLAPQAAARKAAALSQLFSGKKRGPQPPEVGAKISAVLKLAHKEGRHPGSGMTGKKHSEATRAKLRAIALKNGYNPYRMRKRDIDG